MGFLRRTPKTDETHDRAAALSLQQWASMSFNGNPYAVQQSYSSWSGGETTPANYVGYVAQAYQACGPVFACVLARQLIFSEARFGFRRYEAGRPTDLFGDPSLSILENPWPNGTTGELLGRMEQDGSLAGNSFIVRRPSRLVRLRPDWVTIIAGSETYDADPDDVDAEVLGYAYRPRGTGTPQFFDVSEVAHYSPIPDPLARWRGMSWLTPVLREIGADQEATEHKAKFFANGATPNMVVTSDQNLTRDQMRELSGQFRMGHAGTENAYKTLFLAGGLDATVVGKDFAQMDFKATQGAGETRIAAAAGVPPVIVGLSEGLEASTYSNYAQARRRLSDGTIRPLWRIAAACLQSIVPPPEGAHLWYDDRDVSFLREDVKDQADIQSVEAQTMKALIEAGFAPDDVVGAVRGGDLGRLKGKHTGLTSVQLQRPGASNDAPPDPQIGAA